LGISALIIPLLIGYLSQRVHVLLGTAQEGEESVWMYLAAYPIFMVIFTVVAGMFFAGKAMDSWRDSVRDEIYLVGEVLHNLDES
jgi:predicted Na+-dependent transporter